MEMAKVKITNSEGQVFEVSDLTFEQVRVLVGLNGDIANRPSKGAVLNTRDTPDYKGFMQSITDHAKKFFLVLMKHPDGIALDNLAEELGFDSPMKIGGVTGGGIGKLAPKFGLNPDDLYFRETTRKNGTRTVIYKPGKEIARLR